jgi:hypothetical protein
VRAGLVSRDDVSGGGEVRAGGRLPRPRGNPRLPQVTVDNIAACSDNPYGGETVSFHNMPLTQITVSVDSKVEGGTSSTIVCVDSGNSTVASGSTGATGDGSASTS